MPLNAKGRKILAKLQEEYGPQKGKEVFYAMEASGKLKGVAGRERRKKRRGV